MLIQAFKKVTRLAVSNDVYYQVLEIEITKPLEEISFFFDCFLQKITFDQLDAI